MRKSLLRTLFIALIITIACSFAVACNSVNSSDRGQSSHEHVASGEWQSDASQHWKVCAEDGEKLEVADHTFGKWVTDNAETCTEKGKNINNVRFAGIKSKKTFLPKITIMFIPTTVTARITAFVKTTRLTL